MEGRRGRVAGGGGGGGGGGGAKVWVGRKGEGRERLRGHL